MNTFQNRFTRLLVMLLTLAMIAGAFSGCQKNDPEPSVDGLELLAMETTEPSATEETEPETSAETTEPTVSTEPTEVPTEPTKAVEEPTEPAKVDKKSHTHDYKTSVVAPTTSAKGYTLHTCKTCGYSYKGSYKDKLPSGGSGNSGNGGTHTHSYSVSVTKPTCTKKGAATYTCKTCGYSYKTDEKAALDHNWGEWLAYQAATPDGKKPALSRRECERCGAEEFRSEGLAHIPGELIETVAPTCTEEGYELHKCLGGTGSDSSWVCDYIHKVNIVPALGHDWSDWVVTTQPTQDKEGVETRTCSRCNATETRKLPVGHTHKYEVTATVPATCTAAGKKTYTCSCGDSYKEDIPATGHAWGEWVRTQEPTEESEGIDTRTCSNCDVTETRKVDKLPAGHTHKYEITATVPATCTAAGKNTYTCSCGDSYEEEISATGHAWGEWVRTQEPTEESEGIDTRTCSQCDVAETRPVEKLKPETPEIDTSNSVIATNEALDIINAYRAEEGLYPLSAGGGEEYAKIRAAELNISFSHTRPNGEPALVYGNPYGFCEECIFGGSSSAQDAVDWWMASTWGHRDTLMTTYGTRITVARNGYNWVLLLGY